jgi:hypothetical protein
VRPRSYTSYSEFSLRHMGASIGLQQGKWFVA